MSSLSDLQIRGWIKSNKPIAGKSDGGGLTFTLSRSGIASWVLRYRIAGKAKELTLGRYPDLSLSEARKSAAVKRCEVQQVIDVAAVKQQKLAEAKQKGTVKDLTELWLNNTIRRKHKHPQVTERVFKRDILPALGKKDTTTITTGDVTRLLAKINASGRPTIANDALRYLKSLFDYGEMLGMVERNPAERIRNHHAGGQEKARIRALSQKELSTLFDAMDKAVASPRYSRHLIALH